ASLNLYKAKATRLKSLTREELGSDWELPKDILETNCKISKILQQIKILKVPLTRKVQVLFGSN
ncbi:hypothetical protein C0991_005714, partial [Blastosporella zonata]